MQREAFVQTDKTCRADFQKSALAARRFKRRPPRSSHPRRLTAHTDAAGRATREVLEDGTSAIDYAYQTVGNLVTQTTVTDPLTAVSTSTRNFPNRLGIDTRVYLSSAELAAVCALLGKIPTPAEYLAQVKTLEAKAADVYRYMNFDQIAEFKEVADSVSL